MKIRTNDYIFLLNPESGELKEIMPIVGSCIYCGNFEAGFKEIYKEKKDCLPYATFQFGAVKFPSGVNDSDTLWFQPVAVRKGDLELIEIRQR